MYFQCTWKYCEDLSDFVFSLADYYLLVLLGTYCQSLFEFYLYILTWSSTQRYTLEDADSFLKNTHWGY